MHEMLEHEPFAGYIDTDAPEQELDVEALAEDALARIGAIMQINVTNEGIDDGI